MYSASCSGTYSELEVELDEELSEFVVDELEVVFAFAAESDVLGFLTSGCASYHLSKISSKENVTDTMPFSLALIVCFSPFMVTETPSGLPATNSSFEEHLYSCEEGPVTSPASFTSSSI